MNKYLTVDEAVNILNAGGVVAVPTETVYGLACMAENPEAVSRIYQIKNRPADNPLICHFQSIEQLMEYIETPLEAALILLKHFTPGPISFLLNLKKESTLKAATGGREKVVARIPSHPMFLSILKKLNKPIAAPSANSSGKYSATSADMVLTDIGDKIDGVVDGGPSSAGIESTILSFSDTAINILRPGVIGPDDIKEVLKSSNIALPVLYAQSAEVTPGSKYKHYAPLTPLVFIDSIANYHPNKHFALITVDEAELPYQVDANTFSLGSIHKPEEIAANLYRTLFEMDQLQLAKAFLYLPTIPDKHWQHTLYNRIQKMIQHT